MQCTKSNKTNVAKKRKKAIIAQAQRRQLSDAWRRLKSVWKCLRIYTV